MNQDQVNEISNATVEGFIMGLEQAAELFHIWKRSGFSQDECLHKLNAYIEQKKIEAK